MRALRAFLAIALVGLAAGLVALWPTSAYAGTYPNCGPGETASPLPGGGGICIVATDPGSPGSPGDPGGGSTGGGDAHCYDQSGAEVPCTKDGLSWFGAPHYCYGGVERPQGHPPAGKTADEGTWYECTLSSGGNAETDEAWWVEGATPTPPDPAQLARTKLKELPLVAPTIHMAPQPPLMTYVGLPTWLWIDPGQWSNVTGSVTAGATTVSVVAKPVDVSWDLTEGTTSCDSAGRAWVKGMASDATTDCSYTFEKVSDFQPGGTFAVSAEITYQVDWTCTGDCTSANGTLGQINGQASDAAIRVGERQSVVVR